MTWPGRSRLDVPAEDVIDGDALNAELRAQLGALKRPVYRHRGRLYRGRILSFDQWRRFEAQLCSWQQGTLTDEQVMRLIYLYITAIFPDPWWKWAALAVLCAAGVAAPVCAGWSAWGIAAAAALALCAALVLSVRWRSVAWIVSRQPPPLQVRLLNRFLARQAPATAVYLGQLKEAAESGQT